MNRLSGRRIVVTGAASGLGAAIAALFAAEGASLALLDRDQAGATAKAKDLSAFAVAADVTDHAAMQDAAERVAQKLGGVDGIVNAAGILQLTAFEASEPADWQKTIAVNLTGPWNVCRAMLPHLRKSKTAAIVNVASGLGLRPAANYSSYAASKGGLIALTRALAVELAPTIRVNALCPGAVETPMTAPLLRDPAARAQAAANYPLGRLGTPLEIAQAALFLIGPESGFVTGIAMPIDGGRALH
jgi:NAD(P)-dependent dehydrogenase (short-subunit alcohol dehydrogenase family)